MSLKQSIAAIDTERARIWLVPPQDVTDLGNGIVPRGTGPKGQYLTVIMFAESELRTLSDEVFWGFLQVAEEATPDLRTLQAVATQMVGYKIRFLDFVGLPSSAQVFATYVDAVASCTSIAEFVALTSSAFTYTNRLHMWVDSLFPWGIANAFRKPAG